MISALQFLGFGDDRLGDDSQAELTISAQFSSVQRGLDLTTLGVTLNTNECPEGKRICVALILVSYDIPATRKICDYILALISYHRCQKKANYTNRQHNFAGMDDMDKWFITQDFTQHHQDALGWRRCNSKASRK
ncbi:hypothetical protein C1645_830088 [Glomus cerebriforme]|uniref:Uncharacterized protein n=1 Tax=Glomus cerebriforme TaxID=658196 RepID=A0A397SST7_9GLOM|nr:hypothetical protein C1645_830088 [Glomus cerebriforme]